MEGFWPSGGDRERYERQMEDLRAEHERNERTINGLLDSLGMAGESAAKFRVLNRIEELSEMNHQIDDRVRELEGLIGANALSADRLDSFGRTLSGFQTCVDGMTVAEKRAGIRTLVRKVVWDGINAHVMLVGADENTASGNSRWCEDSK